MTIYITRGNYSDHAFQGMLKKSEDRHDAVEKLVKAAGGKMLALWSSRGQSCRIMCNATVGGRFKPSSKGDFQ